MKMKQLLRSAVLVLSFAAAGSAVARDDHAMFSIDDALASPAAANKGDAEIRLFFGKQKTPKISKTIGEWKTNKKTNGFNKSDKEACEWAFLSAIIALQERAKMEGGNAVVGIASNYKNEETISETEFMCGSGALMSGVALKGTVVKLGNSEPEKPAKSSKKK